MIFSIFTIFLWCVVLLVAAVSSVFGGYDTYDTYLVIVSLFHSDFENFIFCLKKTLAFFTGILRVVTL